MIDRNVVRRSLVVSAVLTVIVSPLWWFSIGGVPQLAIALQPWSLAILFNGMVPAWESPATGVSPEFVLAATASVLVSLLAYTLIVICAIMLWRQWTHILARLFVVLGSIAAYVILLVVCFMLALADWPTIPAPGRIGNFLDREFGIEPGAKISGARYAYFGIVDGSEYFRFTLPGEVMEPLLAEAGYERVVLEGLRVEALMNHKSALESGPFWWNPTSEGRYFEKYSGGNTKSYMILDDDSNVVFLRRDHR